MIEDDGAEFFVSGGTLPLDSRSYIERESDRVLLESLAAGRYCYVLNARQMGKSSLCVRTMARLGERDIRTVFIDLTQIGNRNVQPAQWYAGLRVAVGQALDLGPDLAQFWKDKVELGPMQRFFAALREVVLSASDQPLVIFVDEIDATRNLPFDTDEFFAGIRECYNRRVHDDAFSRITFCLIGVAVPNDLIQNPVTTPFNVGERVRIDDFSLDEVRNYGPALGLKGDTLARRIHYWTNGQPFLTQSLGQAILAERIDSANGVDELVARLFFDPQALTTNPNLVDIANRLLNDPEDGGDPDRLRADVLSTYERALKGGAVVHDETNRVSVILKLAGLMRVQGTRLVIQNRIYQHVFNRTWIRRNMPGQELVRHRQSFRRGLLRGIGLAAAGCAVVGTLGVLALTSRARAVAAEQKLDYELYVSDMNSLRLYDETGRSVRAAEALERWRNSPHRGFEWDFWMERLHSGTQEFTLDEEGRRNPEVGVLSGDGKTLCVVEPAKRTAVAIDMDSKRVLGSVPMQGFYLKSILPIATDSTVGVIYCGDCRVPATVLVPAGSSSTTFMVTTVAVQKTTTATITATTGSASASASLSITP